MTILSGAQSVDRALTLLSMVGRNADRGAALSALVALSGLNKPTVRRLLLALMRAGLVEQDRATRRYYLGEEAYVLGSLAPKRFGLLELSLDGLRRLSRRSEDASFVSVRRGASSVCLHREEGTWPIRTHALQTGFEHPLGVGAGSLAMLAALTDAEVEEVIAANAEVLARGFPAVDAQVLRDGVTATRLQGYALNPGLVIANSWGIGVAIRHPEGHVAGALSLAAVEERMRMPRRAELAQLLRDEALVVETRLASMYAGRARQPAVSAPVEQERKRAT